MPFRRFFDRFKTSLDGDQTRTRLEKRRPSHGIHISNNLGDPFSGLGITDVGHILRNQRPAAETCETQQSHVETRTSTVDYNLEPHNRDHVESRTSNVEYGLEHHNRDSGRYYKNLNQRASWPLSGPVSREPGNGEYAYTEDPVFLARARDLLIAAEAMSQLLETTQGPMTVKFHNGLEDNGAGVTWDWVVTRSSVVGQRSAGHGGGSTIECALDES